MNFLDDSYYFPTTDTTSYDPSSVFGKEKISGDPIFEGKTTAGTIVDDPMLKYEQGKNPNLPSGVSPASEFETPKVEDESINLYQKNIEFLGKNADKTDEQKFNNVHDFLVNYADKKNEDGTPAIQFLDKETNVPISLKTLDEWKQLSPEKKAYIYNTYTEYSNSPWVTMNTNSSDGSSNNLFDIALNKNGILSNEVSNKKIIQKHNDFMLESANGADGEMLNNKNSNIDRFSYHRALLNEDGTVKSKQEYDNVIKSRYNTLVSKNYLLNSQSALAYNAYRNALLIEQDQKRINPNYKSDIVLNNQKLNNLIAENPTVFDLVNSLDGKQLAEFNNQFGFQFNSIAENPYVKECQSPECRQLRARSQEEYNKFLKDNDLLGPNGKYQTPNEVYQKLRNGLEEQTYEKTLNGIIKIYNDPKKTKAISLENSYQYIMDPGFANAKRDVPINYKFDLIDGFDNPNFKIARDIIFSTDTGLQKGTLNEKGVKFSFFVDNANMQNIGLEDEVTIGDVKYKTIFNGDDATDGGKYLKGIIEYLSNSFMDEYNTSNPEKNPAGEVIYREFLQNDDIGENYEVYTIKFNKDFLNRPEFKKVILGDESGEETESGETVKSSKKRDAILQSFKDNGLTVYIPKKIAQEKFEPSIERKAALDISPIEAAISETGSYNLTLPRAGSLNVVKDKSAGVYRINGNYLTLGSDGNYISTPFKEESIPIEGNKKLKIPYDVNEVIMNRINYFRNTYNLNTKYISNNNELGVKMRDDIYTRFE